MWGSYMFYLLGKVQSGRIVLDSLNTSAVSSAFEPCLTMAIQDFFDYLLDAAFPEVQGEQAQTAQPN